MILCVQISFHHFIKYGVILNTRINWKPLIYGFVLHNGFMEPYNRVKRDPSLFNIKVPKFSLSLKSK